MSQAPENLLPGYFRLFQGNDGGFVDIHETHGKLESRQNIPIALFLAARGEQVRLLPVLRVPGVKCADASRNGVEWEFKTLTSQTTNAIDTALRNASKQADRVLLAVVPGTSLTLLEQAMFNRVRRAPSLHELAILPNGNLHQFSRSEILQGTFQGRMI